LRPNNLRHRTVLGAEASPVSAGIVPRTRSARTGPGTRKSCHLISPIAGCRWLSEPAVRRPARSPPNHPSEYALPPLIRSHGNPPKGRFENRFRADTPRWTRPSTNASCQLEKAENWYAKTRGPASTRGLIAPPRESKFPTGEKDTALNRCGMWRIRAGAASNAAININGPRSWYRDGVAPLRGQLSKPSSIRRDNV
jgi:hypothetical protein